LNSITNHRIIIHNTVDTGVSIVLKKEIEIYQKTNSIKTSFYFGLAGYKNSLVFGSQEMYEFGGMQELIYETGMWYTLNLGISFIGDRQIILYLEVDDNGNLWGYFGENLAIDFNKDDREISTKIFLLTPIEYKLLKIELLKDRKEFLNEFDNKIKQ